MESSHDMHGTIRGLATGLRGRIGWCAAHLLIVIGHVIEEK